LPPPLTVGREGSRLAKESFAAQVGLGPERGRRRLVEVSRETQLHLLGTLERGECCATEVGELGSSIRLGGKTIWLE